MTPALCDRVHEFVDGELSTDQAAAFRDHLASCAACQAELEDALQLAALVDDARLAEPREAAAVISLSWYRRRRNVVLGATVAVAAAAALLLWLRRTDRAPTPGPALALAPTRSIEARVAWAEADRYRPYEVLRGGAQKHEPFALADLARLEQHGDLHGVAAAYLLDGDWQRADETLAKSGDDPEVRSDRAVILLGTHRPGDALTRLDQLLGQAPEFGPALWNRGLALRDLGLAMTAAAAFDRVAALGEPGWSTEARQRADALRGEVEQRREASLQVVAAANTWIGDQSELPPDFAGADRGLARGFFYELVRAAPSRSRVESLRPLAEELDRELGTSVLRDYVARIAAADFAVRAPLATRYGRLVRGELAPEAVATLRREVRRAGLDDILMGILLRDDGRIDGDEMSEYTRLVARAGDPWFEILRFEMSGRNRSDAADYASAEAALLEGRAVCQRASLDFRCGRIESELGRLYLVGNRVGEAAPAVERAREAAFRNGDWFLQEATTRLAALVLVTRDDSFGSHFAEARAFYAEAVALRPEDCELRVYADEKLAALRVSQLRFDDARAQLAAGMAQEGGCPTETPSLSRAFVLAQVASATGDRGLAVELASMVARLRENTTSAVDRLGLDHIEGRASIETDRAAGRRLLEKVIEAVDTGSGVGGEAQRYRAYSYAVLVADAARHQEYAEALELIADELGARRGDRCALGVAVEADLVVVARGADGAISGQSRRLSAPIEGAADVVPDAIVDRLVGCAVVDVYARPPLLGQPELLPDRLAWRYRVGRTAPSPAPDRRSVRLVVADVEPPATLGLPRLNLEVEAAQPGTQYLRGAAATPRRVREAMTSATEIEIHAHGSVDNTNVDTAWIALSPEDDGAYALTAREVASTRLRGDPVVYLATCHGARSARFFHEGGSLALAFVRAGAHVVIASTEPLPDRGAAELFATLRQRMSHGASAAQALQAIRNERSEDDWMKYIVVFE